MLSVTAMSGFGARTKATTQIAQDSGTVLGNMTGSGGLASAYDGTTDQASAAAAGYPAGGGGTCGKDWGSGNDRIITKVILYAPNDQPRGFNNNTNTAIKIQGSTDNFSSSTVDLASIASQAYNASDVVTIPPDETLTTTTAYRYHRALFTSGNTEWVAEIEWFEDV